MHASCCLSGAAPALVMLLMWSKKGSVNGRAKRGMGWRALTGTPGAQGYLSVNYSDNYYRLSQRFAEVPRLTTAHYEAMAMFNELAKCAAASMHAVWTAQRRRHLNTACSYVHALMHCAACSATCWRVLPRCVRMRGALLAVRVSMPEGVYHARARCDEFRLDYYLQPGDIQLLNNHTCLHTRGAFTDFPVRPRARLGNPHACVRCGNLTVSLAGMRPHRVHVPMHHASWQVIAVC